MRILQLHNQEQIRQIMRQIKVDSYGIEIMAPKAAAYLIKLDNISNIAANILKQEMLSLGADAAVSRNALTGKDKKTGCLIMGSLAQFIRLAQKLKRQPFGLNNLARDIKLNLDNYQKDDFILNLGRYKLNLARRTHIMGILNLTPDSFSGDGLYKIPNPKSQIPNYAVDYARRLVEDGADIIDIGGESSRPGARPVALKEELRRVIPAIKAIVKKVKAPVSIDTCKPEVARQALDSGALIVNDITALRDPRMLKVASKYNAAVIAMHMKGGPRTMQDNPRYESLIDEITQYLDTAVKKAQAAGIDKNKIIIDPGLGFGKTAEHNLEILRSLREFKILGQPILVGPSRKSFIGKILRLKPQERIFGTVAACSVAALNGAHIVRVHDVRAVKDSLKIVDSINN